MGPQSLVAMAFSVFERAGPQAQQVLKAASVFEGDFSLLELKTSLEDLDMPDLIAICKKLSEYGARTLRKIKPTDKQGSNSTTRRPSLNPAEGGNRRPSLNP